MNADVIALRAHLVAEVEQAKARSHRRMAGSGCEAEGAGWVDCRGSNSEQRRRVMGLDVSMYSKIEFVREDSEDDIDWQTEFRIWGNLEGFESRFVGRSGVYRYADSSGFCAGSYGGYNVWRELLAKLAGYKATLRTDHNGMRMSHAAGAWEASGGPFHELVHFADNEGAIGAGVSAKLSRDFIEWRERAVAFAGSLGSLHADRFMETYDDFARAFAMAADDGVVVFH